MNQITQKLFGTLPNGESVYLYTLSIPEKIEVEIISFGGIIKSLKVPDNNGRLKNIVLGFDTLESYLSEHPYFGALIGRYGNRIAQGKFSIDGNSYIVAKNNGNAHLHGGNKGFDKVPWDAMMMDDGALKLSYVSPNGEEGYPGNLHVTVVYSIVDDSILRIEYHALCDKPTPLNLTSHAYFNLSGDLSTKIYDHELLINAYHYLPVDEDQIPFGHLATVAGTPFDFSEPKVIGPSLKSLPNGFDHTYVLHNEMKHFIHAGKLRHHSTGRTMDVYTTEPGMQFYSGNFLDGTLVGYDSIIYQKHCALCLETQHYPDSPNQPEFPNTILRPGDTFSSTTEYRFSVE